MRLAAALLCDFASIREGLLHVLGAGITRLWRENLPGPLAVTLALMIEVPGDETMLLPHEVHVRIVAPSGDTVADVMGGFQISDQGRLEVGENQLVPQVIHLHTVGFAEYGAYVADISLDGQPAPPLRFWILHPEERLIPPIN